MTDKALNNSIRSLIEGKVHRAYTVACDDLLLRGYLTHDERMAIGGLIGKLLSAFGDDLDSSVAARVVAAEDVEAIVETKQTDVGPAAEPNLLERAILALKNVFKQADGTESLEAQQSEVYRAFGKQFYPQPVYSDPGPWLVETFADHVIIVEGEMYWRVPYTSDGGIVFAARSEWAQVESKQEWVTKATRLKERNQASPETGVTVVKAADGTHRWVLFSSSAYKDRDGEIVSTKAQEADIAALDAAGDHGVLRWWHVGTPTGARVDDWRTYKAGPGVDLGICDYAAMHGRIRVESGTFYDEGVGAAFKEVADQLTVSLGFSHPIEEPNGEGEFDHMHTFERSLLPKGVQSNLFVDVPLIVNQKEAGMDDKKLKALKALVGDDLAQKVVGLAEATQKSADDTGVRFKELDKETDEEAKPAGDEKPGDEEAQKIGDMTRAQLKEYIGQCMAPYVSAMQSRKEADAEMVTYKAAVGKVNEIVEAINGHGKRLKALEGDLPAGVKRGYRASQAEETVNSKVTEKEVSAQTVGPKRDFFDWAANGGTPAPVGGTPPPAVK